MGNTNVCVVDTCVATVEPIIEINKDFHPVQFVKGKADLSKDAQNLLLEVGELLSAHPELQIVIEGHASAEGNVNFIQRLSEARAQAAAHFLVNNIGIDAQRITTNGYGSSHLKDANNPTAAENRRTEFVIVE